MLSLKPLKELHVNPEYGRSFLLSMVTQVGGSKRLLPFFGPYLTVSSVTARLWTQGRRAALALPQLRTQSFPETLIEEHALSHIWILIMGSGIFLD